MASEILKRDQDRITVLGAVTDDSNQFITQLRVDPATSRLKVSATISGGGTFIAQHFNTDVYSATNAQTVFTASQTVIQDRGFYIGGSRATPVTDYTVSGSVATLIGQYAGGVPATTPIVWDYIY